MEGNRNCLIVFYSRTGTTGKVARAIAEATGGELEKIRDKKNRGGILGWLGAAKDAVLRRSTEIEPADYDPGDYDLVVIGTPVWAMTVSCAVRAYLTRYRERLPEVAFFLTTGSSGIEKTFQHMEEECGKAPVARLALTTKAVRRDRHVEEVRAFVDRLEGEGSLSD
ncbi:MAG: flavodoxin [Candidatus Brocadiaceae bacterium]|jgi:flavodoxin